MRLPEFLNDSLELLIGPEKIIIDFIDIFGQLLNFDVCLIYESSGFDDCLLPSDCLIN